MAMHVGVSGSMLITESKKWPCFRAVLFKCLSLVRSGTDRKTSVVDDSDSSEEESDNTVYECPGLAPVRVSFCFK